MDFSIEHSYCRKFSWSIENSQYRAKVQRNELSSQRNVGELTRKGKGRSSSFRGSKTNTTTSVFRGCEKHFLLQCSLVFFLVRPGSRPSCKTEENVFMTKDMQVSAIFMWHGLLFNLTRRMWISNHTSTCQPNMKISFFEFQCLHPVIKPFPRPCKYCHSLWTWNLSKEKRTALNVFAHKTASA